MQQMRNAFAVYSGFIRKSGIVEVFRETLWGIALEGSRRIAFCVVMFYITKAEKKVQKSKEARAE